MNPIQQSCKGAINITGAIINVILVVIFIPIIVMIIAGANLTATETTLLGLTTLFIVLALVISIVNLTGLMK